MFSEPKKISFAEIEKYRLPIYNRKGKEKFVYFYVLDPDSVIERNPKLKRIRKKFNHIHSKKERDEAALRFPSYYQFYSLKDTGITDTIDRIGLSVAKDQARHSSVATTNKYVRKDQLTAHPELKNVEGNL